MTDITFSRRAVLGALASATGLAALGGRALAAEPLRIGALNPITGAASAFGAGMQKTLLAAAAQINQLGGPAGRTVEIFAEDSQTSPEPALLAARKLIEVHKVMALIGVYSSPEALAVLPATNAAGVILMHNGAAPKLIAENVKGLAFQFYPGSDAVGAVLFRIVAREGFQRPAALTLTNDASIGNTAAFARQWQARKGSAAVDLQYQPNQPSYRSELQTVMAKDPDVIIINGYEPDVTILVRQLYELGTTAKIIAPEFAVTPRLITAVGKDLVEGILVYRFVPNQESPAFKDFDALYRQATGQSGASNIFAAMAYDELNILCLAAQKAGPTATTAEIAAAVRAVSGPQGPVVSSFAEGQKALRDGAAQINYEGASGPVDFDAHGATIANFGVSIVENGTYRPRYDVKLGD